MAERSGEGGRGGAPDVDAIGETAGSRENPEAAVTGETFDAIDIDLPVGAELEAAMREAVEAVTGVEAAKLAGSSPRKAGVGPNSGLASVRGLSGDDQDDQRDQRDQITEGDDRSETGALRREIADLRDRSLRTLADFDNFRKRSERERQDLRRYALLEPLRELLPIADNLERAISAEGSAEDLKRGVAMVLRQLQDLLRRLGVREVPTDGAAFDPAVHEAVAREESAAVTAPTVAETLVRGYHLFDRLLRPAMVKVAVPPEKPAPETMPGEPVEAVPSRTGAAGDIGGMGGMGDIGGKVGGPGPGESGR
jgi:molecular chaperone GrpE